MIIFKSNISKYELRLMMNKTYTMRHRWRLKLKTVLKISTLISSASSTLKDGWLLRRLYSLTFLSRSSISWYRAIKVPVRPTPAEQWTSTLTWFGEWLETNFLKALTITRIESLVRGAEWSGHPMYWKCVNECLSEI